MNEQQPGSHALFVSATPAAQTVNATRIRTSRLPGSRRPSSGTGPSSTAFAVALRVDGHWPRGARSTWRRRAGSARMSISVILPCLTVKPMIVTGRPCRATTAPAAVFPDHHLSPSACRWVMSRTTQVSGVLLGLWKGRQPGQTSGSLDLMRRPVSCFAPGPGGVSCTEPCTSAQQRRLPARRPGRRRAGSTVS